MSHAFALGLGTGVTMSQMRALACHLSMVAHVPSQQKQLMISDAPKLQHKPDPSDS